MAYEDIPKENSLDSMEGAEKQTDNGNKIFERFLAILKEEERFEENSRRGIIEIHKYNPKYIFLTETSSIPSGYIMKEGLKNAYPDSQLPDFFRINPGEVIEIMEEGEKIVKGEKEPNEEFNRKKMELELFFKKRIVDRNARILIYDADWYSGKSPGSILSLLKTPTRYGFSDEIQCNNLTMNLSEQEGHINLKKEGEKYTGRELNTSRRTGTGYVLNLSVDEDDIIPVPGHIGPLSAYPETITGKKIKSGAKPGTGRYNFRAKIVHKLDKAGNKEHIDQLAYIKALKQFGREIGLNIKEKSENT